MRAQCPRPRSRADLPPYIAAIAEMLFQSRGYTSVTMEQIATQAGVSKRTLYKYFPVKEALLESMLEAALANDLERRDFSFSRSRNFRANLAELLRESTRWCERNADLLLPYIRYKFATFDPGTARSQDRGLLPVWTMLITDAQDRGDLNPTRSAEQLGTYFHYLYLGALMRWLTNPQLDLREEFDAVVELFVGGAANHRA